MERACLSGVLISTKLNKDGWEEKRFLHIFDIRFLLIGPLWVLTHLYAVLELPIEKGEQQ